MSTLAVGLVLVALVLTAHGLGGRLSARWRAVPLLALCALLALVAVEFTCYDHGYGRELAGVAFVGAPVVVIFGGALAAARRWYGYPDLGPLPGRFALAGLGVLVGVLFGAPLHAAQAEASMRVGEDIARHDDIAKLDVPTEMGFVASPRFDWDRERKTLSFPLSTRTALALDVAALRAAPASKPSWKRIERDAR